jgi:hypothetical protein
MDADQAELLATCEVYAAHEEPAPPEAAPPSDDDPDWFSRGADEVDAQLALQEGNGAHTPTPYDPDADDGYRDNHFLHEVDPHDAHRLDEGDRRQREATRRPQ